MADQKTNRSEGAGITRSILILSIATVVLLIAFQYIKRTPVYDKLSDVSILPKKVDFVYSDASFDYALDDQNTLAILENPFRYKAEFIDLVEEYNLSSLRHLSNRMGLNDSIRVELPNAYMGFHREVAGMIFSEYSNIKDGSSSEVASWYQQNAGKSVEHFHEVMSRYTCFITNKALAAAMEISDTQFTATGKGVETPCGIAYSEALRPTIDRLKKTAAIEDFARSRDFLNEKVETAISELAVLEIKDKKGIKVSKDTRVWRYALSTSDMDITAISYLKIGFDLKKFFDIKVYTKSKSILVTLPEPEVLSHEVFPKVENLDMGWLSEFSEEDFNENFNELRVAFFKDAKKDNAFARAKEQASDIISLILDPVVATMNNNYKIVVRFRDADDPIVQKVNN